MRLHRMTLLSTTLVTGLVVGCSQLPASVPGASQNTNQALVVPASTAQRGNIQQVVSFSGDVRAKDQITVYPKATGRVETVMVGVGSPVHAGDVLAELDQDSPEIQVLQARSNVEAAQAKLATVLAGPKEQDIQSAQEALAQQAAKLAAMQAQGRNDDVAAAQAALSAQQAKLNLMLSGGRPETVTSAEAALNSAQQKLQSLQNGATEDVRQAAASAVAADTAQLSAVEAAYAALGGTNAADLQSLQSQADSLTSQVSAAQSAVSSADAALRNQTGSSAADVQSAQTAYDQAQASLSAAQAALKQAYNPPQATVAQAQAAVAQAQAQQAAAESNQTALEQNVAGACAPVPIGQAVNQHTNPITGTTTGTIMTIAAGDNSTACGAAKAAANAAVDAGNTAVEAAQGQLDLLRRGGTPASQVALQAQVASADALVKATKSRLDAITNGGVQAQRSQLQAARDQAQSQLNAAQDSLTVAVARLSAAQDGTLDAQRKAAAANVDAAREKLKADQARLEQIVAGPQDEDVQVAQDAITQAEQQVALASQPSTQQEIEAQRAVVSQAQDQLRKAAQPYTGFDLEQQQHVVNQAQAQLDKAQNPYTDQDVQAAQAAVDQAQAALQLAELGVRETEVVAPVDGIVFDRQVSPGALVSPQSPIVVLIPPSLEVDANVDEAQLGRVSEGQPVSFQVPAYPDQSFTGIVTTIAPAIDQKTRTATVHIDPKDVGNKLRAGMMAQINIVTSAQPNALMVPREAIVGSLSPNAPATVITLDGGKAQRTNVQTGLVSDQYVQITSGLADGQVVAVGNSNGLNSGDVVVPQLRTALAPPGVQ